MKTTVITYDDGTSDTQTSFTTDPDSKPSSNAEKAYGQDAGSYLASLDPGTLFKVSA